ncbi:hypothetical protein B0H13DRAFT_1876188 [Mycena leptocephala]|nr:hypothetical protein B0H13DRAFT_1876188 [Mycena leptocephala]
MRRLTGLPQTSYLNGPSRLPCGALSSMILQTTQRPHDDNDDNDSESESKDIVDSSSGPTPVYTSAKKALFTRVSVESLERDHGANDFLLHLANFLGAETALPRDFNNISAPFLVYKHVVIKLQPVVHDAVTKDPIRAICGTASSRLKCAKAAQKSTLILCLHERRSLLHPQNV